MLVQFSEVPMANVLPRKVLKPKKKSAFDVQVFLDSVGATRRVAEFRKKQAIFSQGESRGQRHVRPERVREVHRH